MSGEERRRSQRKDFARLTEAEVRLYQALEAHKFNLESTRDYAGHGLEALDRRIEAVQMLFEWLDHHPIEPQTPPSSRWISHSGDTPTDLVV